MKLLPRILMTSSSQHIYTHSRAGDTQCTSQKKKGKGWGGAGRPLSVSCLWTAMSQKAQWRPLRGPSTPVNAQRNFPSNICFWCIFETCSGIPVYLEDRSGLEEGGSLVEFASKVTPVCIRFYTAPAFGWVPAAIVGCVLYPNT